ncbi:MAG: 1-acyl-sn-glycerol-3-phosphate acyltransferase [Saprospiraceae bacterium]|nr:1-acyl-sn-glycerol-3-phosphate acyltransferase [Saprospiraceae bacterium]
MKKLLYVLAALRGILIFLAMALFMIFYGISCIFIPHTKDRALRLRESYLKYVCIPILNIHIQRQGSPIDTPALYVGNHRSFTDPIVLCRYLKGFVIAKAEVANYPIINKGAELTGVIWVNRNDKESRENSRNKLVETIQLGFNIIVYPEGTVGKEKNTLPFRLGTFIEAASNNIPVIPVAIEYKSKQDMWVLQKFLPQYFHQYSKWRTDVKLSFGSQLSGKTAEELHQQALEWINVEIEQMQKDWSEAF